MASYSGSLSNLSHIPQLSHVGLPGYLSRWPIDTPGPSPHEDMYEAVRQAVELQIRW